ncbi:two-component regulator propeller domain-containing protein [Aequorivita todarodis]|uniref:hybrid sensor histidine kinase/response regulator transcription factor n=1 Tax=Aequorivita todarodis TaxID=2036821 RepID=UPI00235023FC|nr:hybrid sensor histidine kinase/response regulator transcription factor [Aequorivita todarodis]MDC8000476.1 two-component regulator propeller domain-containing protein [Aequorivita todarodis]
MKSLKLLLFCLLPCIAISQSNKQVAFRELTVEQGLSQNSVVSIAQDSTGFMWFATQDGLNKYDGRDFSHFDIQFEDVTRPTYSKLGKIYVAKKGELWIVSNSGKLQKYNPQRDAFDVVSGVKKVSTLIQSETLNYFIGTYGNGIYTINHQAEDTIQFLKPKDSKRTIYDFFETDNNTILASTNNGFFEIKNEAYVFREIMPETNFSAISQSKNNTLYLGSYGKGLFIKYPNESNFQHFKGFKHVEIPQNLIIQDLLIDKRNQLWIATYGQGVYLVNFEKETIQNFTEDKNNPYALHYNDVLSLFEDNTGTIWLGTDGTGLSYFDEYLVKFNVLTNDQVPLNVNVDVIRAIAKDAENNIWVGTSGKGLTRLNIDKQDFYTYTAQNSELLGDRIMSLLVDEDNLWIGHQTQGLQLMDTKGKITSFAETASFTIWKIHKDENGVLWLCTRDHGLVQFDKNLGIMQQFTSENSNLSTNNIRTIERGKAQELWIGTETDGLFKLDTKTKMIEKVESINSNIKSLFFNGPLLLIGTNGEGLQVFNPKEKTIEKFTTKEGLPNNVIYGILPDGMGYLWLSSNKGITKLKIENNTISEIKNYSNYDGLQAFEFNTGAYYKDKNGVLYFGGLEGLNWFDPNQLITNPIKPKTVISGFEVFNKERGLAKDQKLEHDENTVTFTFSSLHFSQPERNQYKYKLINNDDDWIEAGNNNVAHYTNLPPNDYEFQVISSNYDGVWNTTPASYSFSILKPWYATTFAKVMYAILILLFAYYLYRYLKWRWQIKNQLRLEHEETERLKKLDELKTKLYTNISHEFRTPLTLISGPIENQLAKPKISKEDKKELSLVKQNADRLLSLVGQMLDLSMIDSGQRKLTIKRGDLSVLFKQLISAFQYKASDKKITITSKIHNLKNVWFDKDVIEKVASNLVLNAIKYSPEGGKIFFEASEQEEALVLSIINTTQNVGKKDLSKLFQRFYQDDQLSDGVGVGLALVRELVTLSKGTIVANTIADNEIQFSVSLPINKEAFEDEVLITDEEIVMEPTVERTFVNSNKERPLLLVVENEPDIRAFIISIFKADYQIKEAENGKIGVEIALKDIPDLIISDIMMPEVDGIQLCNTLKSNELTSHVPIILLTAKAGEENEIEGIKTGADVYVTKPFNSEKLKIWVEKLIENRRQLQKHFSKTLSINPELAITSAESEFLKRLQKVLDEHITDPEFSSDGFGKLMHMSRTQLHRKLKAITGMSASEFIRSQRLKLAIRLLRDSDASVAEIAYQVGFNTPSYFGKCFKEVYNCSPTEYLSKNP